MLRTILNDDELISHLEKMDFFVNGTDLNHNQQQQMHHNQQQQQQQMHHNRQQQQQHLGQPMRSSFVKKKIAPSGGFIDSIIDNSNSNNDSNSNHYTGQVHSNSPIALRMQQGIPELNTSSVDGQGQRVISRGPAGGSVGVSHRKNRRGRYEI